jgi:hypothetical protein
MTTGVQCKNNPLCRIPAPHDTGVCHEHCRQIRLAAMQRSASPSVRILGRVLTLLADREAGS